MAKEKDKRTSPSQAASPTASQKVPLDERLVSKEGVYTPFRNLTSVSSRFSKKISSRMHTRSEEIFVVSPGIVLLLIGVGIVIFPRLFLTLIAFLVVFIGLLLCFVGWKLLQFKRKVMKMARDFEAKVYVQGVQVSRSNDDGPLEEDPELKKFILH